MRRFLLLLVFTSPALYATEFTYTSCTAGPTTLSPCPGDWLVPGGITGPDFLAQAVASVPFPFRSGDLSAGAAINVYSYGTVPVSATAIAQDSVTFFTGGPLRPGLVSYEVTMGNAHADFPEEGEAVITDGVHRYSLGCQNAFELSTCTGTLPINLGSEFTASVSVSFEQDAGPGSLESFHAERDVTMSFSLSEAPVPEPSTWGLLILGLGVGAIGLFRRGIAKSWLDHDRDL